MIRPYSPSDKPAVLHIWREASAIAHPFLSAALVAQAEAMIRDQFLDLAETWMIDADDTPAGFIALLGNEVGGLFVLPSHQGKGYGRALLDHALPEAQHVRADADVARLRRERGVNAA